MSTNKDESAKDYLQRHNLHILFEQMAYKILTDRPSDPTRHLHDQLVEKLRLNASELINPISINPPKTYNKRIIFVVGGPGSGKGTQCDRLQTQGYCKCISSGDLLRKEQEEDSPEGMAIKADMLAGRLVSKNTVLVVLKKWVDGQPAGSTLLLDGFPREMGQALSFEADIQPCEFVIAFDCPDVELERRLMKRGLTSGRADDNIETIKARLRVFHEETRAAIEYYKTLGKMHLINSDCGPEEVFAALVPLFVK